MERDGNLAGSSVEGDLPDEELADGLSRGELIARSELAIHLRPSIFPADRAAVLECAVAEHAPAELLGQLEAIPDHDFATVQEVWEALGGKREEGSGHVLREDAMPAEAPSPLGTEHFEFRFDRWYRLAALPFGVTPSSAHVDVQTAAGGEPVLLVRFGPWYVSTPVANVTGTCATGPYSHLKTLGPAHLSLVDQGLTFATNPDRGLCIRFRTAVQGLVPTSRIRHPALTVTVADPDALAGVLAV
jgi:hypothetical protein